MESIAWSPRILADDLSGAADCACAFATDGREVVLALQGGVHDDADGLVIDIDSRAGDREHGAEQARRAGAHWSKVAPPDSLFYKKIDSTLRGHVGAEVSALLHSLPRLRGALIAPAFPAQRRALVDGRLRIDGPALASGFDLAAPPLHERLNAESGGGRHALITLQRLRTLGDDVDGEIDRLLRSGYRGVVVDAEHEADLQCLSQALCKPGTRSAAATLLLVGSAGLARALARHASPRRPVDATAPVGDELRRPDDADLPAPMLALVGSHSPAADAQVAAVRAAGGWTVIDIPPAPARAPLQAASQALRRGCDVLLRPQRDASPWLPSREPAGALARLALPLLASTGTLLMTGGDTARALIEALGLQALLVTGELEPGVPLLRASAVAGLPPMIVKAGGFGDPATLLRLRARLVDRRPWLLPRDPFPTESA